MTPQRTLAGPAPRSAGRRRGPTKGDLKEAAILDTAWELLSVQPLSTITVEQLARGAGISRPTFYFYFDSRDAVIRALTTRVAERLHDVVAGLGAGLDAQPTRSIRDQVETRVAAYLARWRDEGPVLRAMVPLYESDPELRAFWDRIVGELSDQVVGAIEQARAQAREQATDETDTGRPDPADRQATQALVAALFAMMWRTGYEISLTKPSKLADRRTAAALTTVWLRTLWRSDDPTR